MIRFQYGIVADKLLLQLLTRKLRCQINPTLVHRLRWKASTAANVLLLLRARMPVEPLAVGLDRTITCDYRTSC